VKIPPKVGGSTNSKRRRKRKKKKKDVVRGINEGFFFGGSVGMVTREHGAGKKGKTFIFKKEKYRPKRGGEEAPFRKRKNSSRNTSGQKGSRLSLRNASFKKGEDRLTEAGRVKEKASVILRLNHGGRKRGNCFREKKKKGIFRGPEKKERNGGEGFP